MRQSAWLIGAICVVSIARIYWGVYDDLLKERLLAAFRGNGAIASMNSASVKFPLGMSFTELGLILKVGTVPAPLKIDGGEVSLLARRLFLLQLSGSTELQLYGGKATADCGRFFWSQSLECRAELAALDLARYPLAQGFGIAGKLNGSMRSTLSGSDTYEADFDLGMKDVSLASGTKVNGIFQLPEFKDGDLAAVGKLSDNQLKVEMLRFKSSLGRLDGHGAFTMRNGLFVSGRTEGTIQLSESGQKSIAPFLALAIGRDPQAEPVERWKFIFSIENARPNFTAAPLN